MERVEQLDTVTSGSLPSGMLTFVFTDIEGSTPRWETAPDSMRIALARHDAIMDATFTEFGGIVFKHTGDGVSVVFTSPERAAKAAIEVQRRLQNDDWAGEKRLPVRIGIHMGEASPSRNDYFGSALNRTARIMDVANGDQIVISLAVSSFLRDMDVQPMGEHQLKGIGTETINLLRSPDLLADNRPLRSRVGTITKRLPVQTTELIGRSRHIEEIAALINSHQSVTVVGPGGVGKTHLVVEVGHAVADGFPDGVIFCELVPLSDGDSVPDAVAEALGARSQPGMTLTESIVNFLETRRVLLIVDNCEHVANAIRDLGTEILAATDSCLLATSREPVGFDNEQLFGLEPLDASTDGVELFIARATERDHSFSVSASDRTVIAKICERLDGVPLGIELAAAWTRVLAPPELLDRLHDRFQVLRGGRSGGRHQTLRDTVQWSYEQLNEPQTRLFDRLSVFAGGFSLAAVEAVCADDELIDEADVLDLVMALVDKSMVMSARGVGHIRFTMLGTLRQFGQEQLFAVGETAEYRSRHAVHFRELAIGQAGILISEREADVWELLDREWSNIRAAFDTMLGLGDVDGAIELVLQLGWFAALSMRFEVFAWLDELSATVEIEARPEAGSIFGLHALSAYFTVDDRAVDFANRGLEIDQVDPYGYCRMALAAVSLNNELSAADSEIFTSDWLEHTDGSSSILARIWAEGMRTFHICYNNPSDEAMVHASLMMDIAVRTDSASAMSVARWAAGMTASFDGPEPALREWRKGIDSAQSLSPTHLMYQLITGLILHFSVSRGDLDEGIAGCLDALEQANEQHYLAGTSHLFGVTAIVLCRLDQAETGAQLLGAMEANRHFPRQNAVRAVQRALGDETDRAKDAGRRLSIDEAAAMAMDALRAAIVTRGVLNEERD